MKLRSWFRTDTVTRPNGYGVLYCTLLHVRILDGIVRYPYHLVTFYIAHETKWIPSLGQSGCLLSTASTLSTKSKISVDLDIEGYSCSQPACVVADFGNLLG